MIFLTFLYEIKIIDGTKNEPVDSAISYIFKISQNNVELIDSYKVKNGILKFEIKDTSIKAIGIQTDYKGFSFYSPIINLPIKNESLFVYQVSNEGNVQFKEYGAFVVNQDSIIMVAEDIILLTNSKNALIPKEPIKLILPKGFENFRYNGLPHDSIQIVGESLFIKPFIVPNTNNLISFVYMVKKKLNLERNLGNINYTVAIRKDLKHSVKNLSKGDIQKMGNIDIQVYRGNKPFIVQASVIPSFDIISLINKNRFVIAGIVIAIIVIVILILQSRSKNETKSKEPKQEN
jgi:hypothetical protein